MAKRKHEDDFEEDAGGWKPAQNPWYHRAAELTEALAARPAFAYDPGKDPLWQGAKEDYLRRADRSMRDTLGRASALTGGYASTYAEDKAQQAYDEEIFRLTELLPDYYDRARTAYDKEGKALQDAIGLALGLYDEDYQAFLAGQKQANWEREFSADEAERLAKQDQWERQFALERDQWDRQFAAKNDQWERQFAADNDRWQLQFDADNDQWQQQFDAKNEQWAAQFAQDLAEWEQKLAEKAQNTEASAARDARSYSYRMAMLALQQGLRVSDRLLEAAGIDKDYAETIRRYFAAHHR